MGHGPGSGVTVALPADLDLVACHSILPCIGGHLGVGGDLEPVRLDGTGGLA